jgi:hypothetical protein
VKVALITGTETNPIASLSMVNGAAKSNADETSRPPTVTFVGILVRFVLIDRPPLQVQGIFLAVPNCKSSGCPHYLFAPETAPERS